MLAKVGLDTAIGRKCFLFQLFIINELGLVDQEPRKGQRVAAAWSILGDDDSSGAVLEGNDVFVFCGLDYRLPEGSGRSPTDDVVDAVDVAPSLPRRQQPGDGIRQAVPVGRHDNTARTARHALHVAQDKRRGYAVRFSCSATGNDNGGVSTDELRAALGIVEIDFSHWSCLQMGNKSFLRGRLLRTQYLRCR